MRWALLALWLCAGIQGCDSDASSGPGDAADQDGGTQGPRDGGDHEPPREDASASDAAEPDASDPPPDASTDASQDPDAEPAENHAPIAYDDEVAVGEDGPALHADVPVATDDDGTVDADGYALTDDVEVGELELHDDGSYVFDPTGALEALAEGQTRSLSFRYTARDDDGTRSAPATIAIAVSGENDAPQVASALPSQAATVDAAYEVVLPADTFGDVDEGDSLTWSALGLPSWLSFTAGTRTLHGTPDAGDVGTVNVTIRVTDEADATAEDTFTLTVQPVATGPIVEQYTYDSAGRLTQVTYGEARVVRYAYDKAGNVLQQEVVLP